MLQSLSNQRRASDFSKSSDGEILSVQNLKLVEGNSPVVFSDSPVDWASSSSSIGISLGSSNKSPSLDVPNRCRSCNKKVGLMGFKCRCERTFYGIHQVPRETRLLLWLQKYWVGGVRHNQSCGEGRQGWKFLNFEKDLGDDWRSRVKGRKEREERTYLAGGFFLLDNVWSLIRFPVSLWVSIFKTFCNYSIATILDSWSPFL